MFEKFLDRLKDEGSNLPNRFTIGLGEQIRDARLEANISQADLADKAYLRQSSISKIEAGTRSVAAEEILYLSYALDKQIIYFFPKEVAGKLDEHELSVLEEELLVHTRKLSKDDLRKLIASKGLSGVGRIKYSCSVGHSRSKTEEDQPPQHTNREIG